MHTQTTALVYLPLQRRAGLVRAFARLVRALPAPAPAPRLAEVPDNLRADLGLAPAVPGRGSAPPPVRQVIVL